MRFHKLEESLRTPLLRKMMGYGLGSADFAELIREAQKFYVGDVENISNINPPLGNIPRLPYQLCVFEFQDVDREGRSGEFFVLAEEVGDTDKSYDMIKAHSFVQFPTNGFLRKEMFLHNGWLEVDRKTMKFSAYANGNTVKFLDSGDGFGRLADKESIHESIDMSFRWLCVFLSVLNCSNTEIVDIEIPEKINKKRKQKGNVPIYSYKTLVLKTKQKRMTIGQGTY